MAELSETIASAVIVPEHVETATSSQNTLKRRQSSISDGGGKRLRLDPGSPTATESRAETRKSGLDEERRRGKRLFANLLGTLSQSSSSKTQQRRVDIEKKQQEKLKLQAEEHDEQKRKKLEELTAKRVKEQIRYDQDSARIRHANMINVAHFLCTRAEPKLYYKPYEPSAEAEARIQSQVEEAEAAVAKDLDELAQELQLGQQEHPIEKGTSDGAEDKQEPARPGQGENAQSEVPTAPADAAETKDPDIPQGDPRDADVGKDIEEEHDETVVEGGEDPVIY